ncbi:MAG: putative zinc-binding protein, partial [Limisphaerales bacterium]
GVGGDVKPLVKTAKSGRPIIALDGCPLHCAAQILKRHGLTADRHFDLSKIGVSKKKHEDFDPKQTAEILQRTVEESKIPVLHTSVAAESVPSPGTPEEELPEPSSTVCYAKEFKD